MAEYYPLLAKAVGSLPNSSSDTRRVVYERARKALIGQLRTLHPPIPDEEIENESVALDRAIERLEAEIANGSAPAAPAAPPKPLESPKPAEVPPAREAPVPDATKPEAAKPAASKPPFAPRPPRPPLVPKPPGNGAPPPLRPPGLRPPTPKPPVGDTAKPPAKLPAGEAREAKPLDPTSADARPEARSGPPAIPVPVGPPSLPPDAPPFEPDTPPAEESKRLKPLRPDRPIAPQPPAAEGPKRRLWILPVAIGLVVAGVAFAAWKLRDHPETIASKKPAETSQTDSSKIAERVGGPKPADKPQTSALGDQTKPAEESKETADKPQTQGQPQAAAPASNNPEIPVAHRAALLVQAPDEPNKIKTMLGTVVWKLNNAAQGPNDAVGVAVEADIDLPEDKMKVVVTFAKNTEASLPASHTINIKFMVEPGSYTGDVKQINVPQMRPEDNPGGEPLAGVTVQIVPNSFLVGLSPGNAETANTELIRKLQWIDIPMLLDNGKLAKLTFEKGDSGQRDLNEAFDAWQKQ